MSNPVPIFKASENATHTHGNQAEGVMSAIRALVDTLHSDDKQKVFAYLVDSLRTVSPRKAGEVLGTIVKFLPRKKEWTVSDIKTEVEKEGTRASDKEIYNAVGYLTRIGHVRRIGYGRYTVNGIVFVTADDLGGERSITEEDGDD